MKSDNLLSSIINFFVLLNEKYAKKHEKMELLGTDIEIYSDIAMAKRSLDSIFFERSMDLSGYSSMDYKKKFAFKSNKDIFLIYKTIKGI